MNSLKVIEFSDKYNYKVIEITNKKCFHSPHAHYIFNKDNGEMISWGKNVALDPDRFPAPNILDLEVTTKCSHNCPFCYKSNNPNGKNMSFAFFKKLFRGLPKSITQIAFGADYDLTSNPDIYKMMDHARRHGVIPNVTVGYLSLEDAHNVSQLCGAVAVSRYEDKDKCYDTVLRLTNEGMKQVNIHLMVSEETYDRCVETIKDSATDKRLSALNAVVLLSLKQKGRGVGFHPLSQEKFNSLIDLAKENKVNIGFDSCSSLKAFSSRRFDNYRDMIIPCEAGLESSYINVYGYYFPCSFCEGTEDWKMGINAMCKSSEEFLDKVWNNERVLEFAQRLNSTSCMDSEGCRSCPYFNI